MGKLEGTIKDEIIRLAKREMSNGDGTLVLKQLKIFCQVGYLLRNRQPIYRRSRHSEKTGNFGTRV